MKQFDDFLHAIEDEPLAQFQRLHLLIDHAGAPGLLRELQGRHGVEWLSLFADSKEEGAIDVAPLLIGLGHPDATAGSRCLLEWLHRACAFSTSLTVLRSTLARDALATALKRRLAVMLPDHLPAMLRFFDTRVLDALVRTLGHHEREQFLGIASRWQWLDRAAVLQSLDAVQLQADLWPSPFQLDESQQNALITASEADTLVQQMRHGAPDLCHGHALATLHAIAGHCITQLDRLGINQMAARTLYCLTALQFGPTFADQPNWEEALGRVAKKQISFMDALKELGM